MLANLIWWSAIALEAVILFRARAAGLLKKYPLFYAYIGCVFAKEIVGLMTHQWAPKLYDAVYWPTDLATIVASYAVVIEIFRWSTRHKPGIRRLTQNALLFVFALTVAYAASDFVKSGFGSMSHAISGLGRDLRYVEGGILLAMLWLFTRYRIPHGRNLRGVIIGYSFWIGVNVVNLALWFLPGNEFSILLRGMLPATYLITLIIWCVTLWSAHPEPMQPSESKIERDYDLLAAKTQTILARSSTRVSRIIRP
jgi:hypothetical protein